MEHKKETVMVNRAYKKSNSIGQTTKLRYALTPKLKKEKYNKLNSRILYLYKYPNTGVTIQTQKKHLYSNCRGQFHIKVILMGHF